MARTAPDDAGPWPADDGWATARVIGRGHPAVQFDPGGRPVPVDCGYASDMAVAAVTGGWAAVCDRHHDLAAWPAHV